MNAPLSADQHTPGPWTAKAETVRENFKPVCNRFAIFACDNEGPTGHIDFSEANARLIAAAPKLLSELKALTTLIERADIVEGHRKKCLAWKGDACACRVGIAMKRINRLIEKVEGRS